MPRQPGAALKVIAQRLAYNPVDFRVIAAPQMLQGVKNFGRQAKCDMFHDPVSPQNGEYSVSHDHNYSPASWAICAFDLRARSVADFN